MIGGALALIWRTLRWTYLHVSPSAAINRRIDSFEKCLEKLVEKIEEIAKRVEHIDEKIDQRIGHIEERQNKLDDRLNRFM